MKKIVLIVSLIIMAYTAHSQVLITLLLGDKLNSDGLEFGLVGGGNMMNISEMDSKAWDTKWNLGFYFDIRVKNQWYLYTGVLVKSNLGMSNLTADDLTNINATTYINSKGENIEGSYSQKMSYFLVPIMINYHFKNHMSIKFGPQLGLMYKSWVQFDADVEGHDAIFKEYNKDEINKIEAGLALGGAYRLFKGTGWTIGAYYYQGLTNVYKNTNTKNRAFFFEVCIPIGAGDKKAIEK